MAPLGRRKSKDSSDSSDSSSDSDSSQGGYNRKKEKKYKDKKKDTKDAGVKGNEYLGGGGGTSLLAGQVPFDHGLGQHPSPQIPKPEYGHGRISMPQEPSLGPSMPDYQNKDVSISSPPPGYTPAPTPSSGFRIPLTTTAAFPTREQAGQPPCYDLDGTTPVYIGSALLQSSVHPCKIGAHLVPFAAVPYGGAEHGHHGRYDLLPFKPDTMEFVHTSYGRIPPGRKPVEGGYEEDGSKLYHGVAVVQGVRVPGKTGEHLRGCNVPFGGGEHVVTENYEILCWK